MFVGQDTTHHPTPSVPPLGQKPTLLLELCRVTLSRRCLSQEGSLKGRLTQTHPGPTPTQNFRYGLGLNVRDWILLSRLDTPESSQ